MCIGYQATQRPQPAQLSFARLHQHHCRRCVVDARGVARGHTSIAFEGRAQFRQLLQRRLRLDMLIGVKDHGLSSDLGFNRQDLLPEVASLDGRRRPLVALECQLVLCLTGDAPLGRYVLSSHAHMTIVKRITEGSYHGVNHLPITHALTPTRPRKPVLAAAHHFSSTTYSHFGLTQRNGLGSRNNRLQSAAT